MAGSRSFCNPIRAFITAVEDLSVDPSTLLAAQTKVVHAFSAGGVDSGVAGEVRALCSELMRLRPSWVEGWTRYEVIRYYKRDFLGFHTKFKAMLDDLASFAALVVPTKLRPAGYLTSDLLGEADIGRDLFRQIVAMSGLPQTRRGDHARRFSNPELERLISAARSLNTIKSRRAAEAWSQLLEANRSALAGPIPASP